MANFLLYKYKFEPTTDHSLFSVKDNETVTADLLSRRLDDSLKMAFQSKAKDPLNLYAIISNRKGETEPESYHNDVLQNFEGVSMIEVRNSRIKKYMPLFLVYMVLFLEMQLVHIANLIHPQKITFPVYLKEIPYSEIPQAKLPTTLKWQCLWHMQF